LICEENSKNCPNYNFKYPTETEELNFIQEVEKASTPSDSRRHVKSKIPEIKTRYLLNGPTIGNASRYVRHYFELQRINKQELP